MITRKVISAKPNSSIIAPLEGRHVVVQHLGVTLPYHSRDAELPSPSVSTFQSQRASCRRIGRGQCRRAWCAPVRCQGRRRADRRPGAFRGSRRGLRLKAVGRWPTDRPAAVIDPAPLASCAARRRKIAAATSACTNHGPVFTAVRPSHETKLCAGRHTIAFGGSFLSFRNSRAHIAGD